MLTFRNALIVFVLLMLGLFAYEFGHQLSAWIYLMPILLLSIFIGWGCYFIQSGFFLKTLFVGPKNLNEIAITFDDGPHENTPAVLEVLNRFKIKATFFFIGKNIEGREGIVKLVSESGHLIGNHSYSHSNVFDFFSVKKLEDDVSKTDELIYKITGKRNKLFRPPFGVTTPNIATMVNRKNYSVIGWSIRSYDTMIKSHDKLLERIFTRMKNGSVILLHESTPGIEIVLEKVLEKAQQMNFKVVSIEEMFKIKAYETA
ncbi:MAG: polysaccharide deacetylase family protein [Bacteroidota bacterium]